MSDKIFVCKFCSSEFDLEEHRPRMITECGHSICLLCLKQKIEKELDINCSEDNLVIKTKNKGLESFPQNVILIKYIQKSKTTAKEQD